MWLFSPLKVGLEAEYQEIRNRDPTGTFYHARMSANVLKNRYTDVPSYDHSRVVLATELSDNKEDEDSGDFINANFVDGYVTSDIANDAMWEFHRIIWLYRYGGHEKAFISTQGPLAQTFCDFWRMVWEQRVQVRILPHELLQAYVITSATNDIYRWSWWRPGQWRGSVPSAGSTGRTMSMGTRFMSPSLRLSWISFQKKRWELVTELLLDLGASWAIKNTSIQDTQLVISVNLVGWGGEAGNSWLFHPPHVCDELKEWRDARSHPLSIRLLARLRCSRDGGHHAQLQK